MTDDDNKRSVNELDANVTNVKDTIELEHSVKIVEGKVLNLRSRLIALFVMIGTTGILCIYFGTRKSASLRSTVVQPGGDKSNIDASSAPSSPVGGPPLEIPTVNSPGISDVFYNGSVFPSNWSIGNQSGTSNVDGTVPTSNVPITYVPGQLTVAENGMLLSQGLTSRQLAQKFQTVKYHSGSESNEAFHDFPDGAATFLDPDPSNVGGWIYVSNSEYRNTYQGGVGAIRFDRDGNVIEYKMVLRNTRANCGGGKTPWQVSNFIYVKGHMCCRFIFDLTNAVFLCMFLYDRDGYLVRNMEVEIYGKSIQLVIVYLQR
jgi:hypothetical protein